MSVLSRAGDVKTSTPTPIPKKPNARTLDPKTRTIDHDQNISKRFFNLIPNPKHGIYRLALIQRNNRKIEP
jgi:hypothetical protein